MELEELRVKESTVKCKMTKTTQKGKEYKYPQYSLTLKKPYVFSKGEEVVVLAGEEVKKVLSIDKAGEVWDGIGKLMETQKKVEELKVQLKTQKDKYTQDLKDLKSTHSTQLENLTQDKEEVENKLKHTKERLKKEHRDLQELEEILTQYSKASIFKVWLNRVVKKLPAIPSKTTADTEEKGE